MSGGVSFAKGTSHLVLAEFTSEYPCAVSEHTTDAGHVSNNNKYIYGSCAPRCIAILYNYTHTHTHIFILWYNIYVYISCSTHAHTLQSSITMQYVHSMYIVYTTTLSRYSSVLAKATSPERQTIWSERVVAVVKYPSERNPTYTRTALPTHHNLTSVTHERLRNIYVYKVMLQRTLLNIFFYIGLR